MLPMLARRIAVVVAVVAGSALLALGVTATGAHAQLQAPASQADRELLESVSRRISRCFTTIGVAKREFELAQQLPAASKLVAVGLLPAVGPVVSDAYAYWIALHESRTQVYVRQVGGFAGAQKLFGPIDIGTDCGGG